MNSTKKREHMLTIEDVVERIGYQVKLFLGNSGKTTVENSKFIIEDKDFILNVSGNNDNNDCSVTVELIIKKDGDDSKFENSYSSNTVEEIDKVVSLINTTLWNNYLV